jgi:hypothetical protein
MTQQDPGGETAASTADGVESFGYRQQLKRSLSFTDLLVYGLIFMVPIAPFGIFGGVFQASGGMVALVYAVGMFAMAFTAACECRELGHLMRPAGTRGRGRRAGPVGARGWPLPRKVVGCRLRAGAGLGIGAVGAC